MLKLESFFLLTYQCPFLSCSWCLGNLVGNLKVMQCLSCRCDIWLSSPSMIWYEINNCMINLLM